MGGDGGSGQASRFSIRMMALQPGASQDGMVAALQRLYKGKNPEEIRRALANLPLLLTRSVTEEQARQIQRFLEARGAILEIAFEPLSPRPHPEAKDEGALSPDPPTPHPDAPAPSHQASTGPLPSGMMGRPLGVERRARERVHTGLRLQPMGTGEILDRSFRLLQGNFWLFFLILLIPEGISFLVGQGLSLFIFGGLSEGISSTILVGGGISAVLAFIVFLIIFIWAQGAMIHAVSETYLGHETTLGAAYSAMRPRLGSLMGTMLLMWLFVGLGTILLVIPGIILFVMWLMTDKVVVLEWNKGTAALGRSRALMAARTEPGFWKGPKIKASLIILVCVVIAIGIHLVLQIPALVLRLAMPDSILIQVLKEVLSAIGESVATAYGSIAMILFYYDIRIRKEGFDLKMMAEYL